MTSVTDEAATTLRDLEESLSRKQTRYDRAHSDAVLPPTVHSDCVGGSCGSAFGHITTLPRSPFQTLAE
jgi:hypothetical protein